MEAVSRQATPDVDLEESAEILRLLADRTRLQILVLLADGERPVGEIAAELSRPIPVVSQHLAKLRTGHLVMPRREGTSIFYALTNEHVEALVTNVLQHTEHVLYPVPPHHAG